MIVYVEQWLYDKFIQFQKESFQREARDFKDLLALDGTRNQEEMKQI